MIRAHLRRLPRSAVRSAGLMVLAFVVVQLLTACSVLGDRAADQGATSQPAATASQGAGAGLPTPAEPTNSSLETAPTADGEPDERSRSFLESLRGLLWVISGLAGVGLGWVAGRATARHDAGRSTRGDPAPAPSQQSQARPDSVPNAMDRSFDMSLAEDLILAHDLADDEAQAGLLTEVLETQQVTQVTAAAGMPFDGTVHKAVDTEATGQQVDVPMIIRVVRPGWQTPHGIIRQPEVVVSIPPEPAQQHSP